MTSGVSFTLLNEEIAPVIPPTINACLTNYTLVLHNLTSASSHKLLHCYNKEKCKNKICFLNTKNINLLGFKMTRL